jgi:hypothetical protein
MAVILHLHTLLQLVAGTVVQITQTALPWRFKAAKMVVRAGALLTLEPQRRELETRRF